MYSFRSPLVVLFLICAFLTLPFWLGSSLARCAYKQSSLGVCVYVCVVCIYPRVCMCVVGIGVLE